MRSLRKREAMLITLMLTLCTAGAPCVTVRITDSSVDPSFTLRECMNAQPIIADFKSRSLLYGDSRWHIKGYQCVKGNAVPPQQSADM